MFFSSGFHQRRLMGLDVTAFAAMVVSSCGGGGGQEDDSAADTTTAGDAEQAPEDALDAALKQSFRALLTDEVDVQLALV
jgi:hypothetical protein